MMRTCGSKGLAVAGLLLGIGLLLIGIAVILRPEIARFGMSSDWSITGIKFTRSFTETITENTKFIEVETINGKVAVTGWDKDYIEILVEQSIRVSNEDLEDEYLQKTTPIISIEEGKLMIVTPVLQRTNELRGQGASIYLSVPKKHLEDIKVRTSNGAMTFKSIAASISGRSSNGGLELISVSGAVTLETSNAPIFVEDSAGTMELRSTNGSFNGRRISGSFVIETSNAPVTIEDGDLNLSVSTTNGAITITESTLFGSENYLKTSNARILCDALLPETGVFEIMTTNGQVNLLVDDSLKAEFDASTTNGSVNLKDLMVAVTSSTSTSMKGNLNGGNGLLITLKTSNSNIMIENRRSDD